MNKKSSLALQYAEASYLVGDFPLALEAYKKAYKENSSDPLICERLGNICTKLNMPKEALKFYEEALGLAAEDTTTGKLHNAIGLVHFHNNDYTTAVTCFEKAISLAPGNKKYQDNFRQAMKQAQRQSQ